MTSFFLMRHGESEANRLDRIISAPEVGCLSYGLTDLGREQARQWAQRAVQEWALGPQTRVIASDFLRTRETASIAAEVLGCPAPIWDQRLRERFFGPWEGTSAGNYGAVWQQDESDPGQPPQGVESAAALTARVQAVVGELQGAGDAPQYLLVSHGDPLRFLQLARAGRPLQAHQSIRHFEPAEIRPLNQLVAPI